MYVLDESEKRRYPEVLAGMLRQLHEGHRRLLNSLTTAEQTLVADLQQHQQQAFLSYKELLDELHVLYQLAAYEAGREAAVDSSAEALGHVMRVLPRLLADRKTEAESQSRVPR